MTGEQIWVLMLLLAALVLLVKEILSAGITGLLIITGLLVGETLFPGKIAPGELPFLGLINSAVIAVGSMFVISAGIIRTGAVGLITNVFLGEAEGNPRKQYIVVLFVVMVASAFVNNTPLVLIFMPFILGLSGSMDRPPSKLLIPLSFVSILGGMCSKIGTSTNIVVSAAAEREGLTLGMFDFTPMGVILAAAGFIFLVIFAERLLPERASLGLGTGQGLAREYMTELDIPPTSSLVGRKIGDAFPPSRKDVRVLQLIRKDVIHTARPDIALQSRDLLLIKGDPAAIVGFHESGDTGVVPVVGDGEEQLSTRRVAMTLVEMVVTPGSAWIGRTVRDIKFRERYGVGVFAIQRHDEHLREKVEDLRLKPGDILLVQGDVQKVDNLKASENAFVVEGVHHGIPLTRRAPIALSIIALFVVMAVALPHQVHVAALVAGLCMVIGRCVTAKEAYGSLDWDVLFLLGGTLSLGAAFDQTGLAQLVADRVVAVCQPYGEGFVIAGVFGFTALLTQVLSNNAAAAVMTPIAFRAGTAFAVARGHAPDPEAARAFVMAVAFGASCCFLTPIGYGTNLLIYGPGGYKFTDFLRIGAPLTVLFCVLAALLLPMIYG